MKHIVQNWWKNCDIKSCL